jgi:hypothetical protein
VGGPEFNLQYCKKVHTCTMICLLSEAMYQILLYPRGSKK